MSDDPKSLLRLKGWLITINTVLLLIVLAIVFAWAIPARAQVNFSVHSIGDRIVVLRFSRNGLRATASTPTHPRWPPEKARGTNRPLVLIPPSATGSLGLRQPRGDHTTTTGATMMRIDQNLFAALYVLGFNFLDSDHFSGEIAEIKGDMTIKLVHPPGEELKFVVELPGEKQMIFSVDQHQIVNLAERWQ